MTYPLTGKKVLFVVASNGYQAKEYSVPKKMLEDHGAVVLTVSDKPGGAVAHDKSTTHVDYTLDNVAISDFDGIFFIGGPGAMDQLDNSKSYHLISEAKKLRIPYGAICISSRILAKAYGLEDKKATGWNGDNALGPILKGYNAIYKPDPIVTDGFVVTAIGPEAAEKFGEGIIRVLTKKSLQD